MIESVFWMQFESDMKDRIEFVDCLIKSRRWILDSDRHRVSDTPYAGAAYKNHHHRLFISITLYQLPMNFILYDNEVLKDILVNSLHSEMETTDY